MKEIVFLNQNVKQWKIFEQFINSSNTSEPDLIADAYIKLTDDLAFAQTYFPDSETEKYLNFLAAKFHHDIYKTKKENKDRFVKFWKNELPFEVLKIRKQIYFSLFIFLISVLLGVLSAKEDISFTRTILGDEYVNMTIENIKNGDPMAVYKQTGPLYMFLRIAQNNFKVMLLIFVFGLLSPLFSGLYIAYHGIMIGAFQFFFYKYNLFAETASTIWLHGTIEMFTMVVAGGAGIMLGNSLVSPGTYTRKYSVVLAGKKGVKILFGLSIFVFFAAFIESFITRHTEWSYTIKLGIIILSLTLIVWYFFIYPLKIKKEIELSLVP